MNQLAHLQAEFLEPTKQYLTRNGSATLRVVEDSIGTISIPKSFSSFDDFAAEFEQRLGTNIIAEGRERLSTALVEADGVTMQAIRLKKGMSQVQLAKKLSTSQPHIARIERGSEDLRISTIRRFASVFDMSISDIDIALQNSERANRK